MATRDIRAYLSSSTKAYQWWWKSEEPFLLTTSALLGIWAWRRSEDLPAGSPAAAALFALALILSRGRAHFTSCHIRARSSPTMILHWHAHTARNNPCDQRNASRITASANFTSLLNSHSPCDCHHQLSYPRKYFLSLITISLPLYYQVSVTIILSMNRDFIRPPYYRSRKIKNLKKTSLIMKKGFKNKHPFNKQYQSDDFSQSYESFNIFCSLIKYLLLTQGWYLFFL